jgi:DNA-binding protein HU-beta
LNKSHLIAHVAEELKTSKLQAGGIRKGLEADESVTLTGFGTFELKPRKARTVRNPHTGEPIQIAAGKRIGFRVGKSLRDSF